MVTYPGPRPTPRPTASGRKFAVLLCLLLLAPGVAACSAGSDLAAAGAGSAAEPDGGAGGDTVAGDAGQTDPAGQTDQQAAGSVCDRLDAATVGQVVGLTPRGSEATEDVYPPRLLGSPEGIVSFAGCEYEFEHPDVPEGLSVDVYYADGGHEEFEKIRTTSVRPPKPLAGLGDEAFVAQSLQTFVYVRKGSRIVVCSYLVQHEDVMVELARQVVSTL
ncbi:hypothetical protein [Kineosporia sp. A_224]|uniref:hypothetical protein n=1 Tax=Kineosporia sp. A_224 TaxID=1962180 RepID=UPI000B4C1DFA|nr:hypothetical protein [Kineosporia sp. A_224]